MFPMISQPPPNFFQHSQFPLIQNQTNLKVSLKESNCINNFSIFIFNINYNVTYEQLLNICSKCGEVSQLIYSPLHKGHALYIYYDLRFASNDIKELNGSYLNDRMVFIKYASENSTSPFRNPEDTCSTTFNKSSNIKTSLKTNEVDDLMAQFGEVKSCIHKKRKRLVKNQWIVEFYDLKSAQKAVSKQSIQFNNEDLRIAYLID